MDKKDIEQDINLIKKQIDLIFKMIQQHQITYKHEPWYPDTKNDS